MTSVVDVLVPVALDRAYSYRVPTGMTLAPGDVVSVPLGPREVIAVVWAENSNPDPRIHNRMKDVTEKIDVPPLRAELRSFVDWVAAYTLSSRGMVMRMTPSATAIWTSSVIFPPRARAMPGRIVEKACRRRARYAIAPLRNRRRVHAG